MLRKSSAVVALLVVGGLAAAAIQTSADPESVVIEMPDPINRDLGDILERDTIVVLTAYTSTSYFLYRGQAFGFEYELLKDFAEDQDIVFDIQVVPRDSILYYLNSGRGDIAAARLEPVAEDTSRFGFTRNLYETQPVVVQREAEIDTTEVATPEVPDAILTRRDQIDDGGLDPVTIAARRVERPSDLAGTEVFLPEDHPYVNRLVELENQITGEIEIVEVDTNSVALIRNVAVGNIELTVAQENVAQLEEGYYDNLLVQPTIGAPHGVAWAVRNNAPQLKQSLNEWILENRDTSRWNQIYRKYYVDRRGYRERIETGYLTGETGVLSDYDGYLKTYAPGIGWDWRLLGSQMYQESRFEPRARSWAGAMGLLQIMPGTAGDLGLSDPYDPEANIEAAVRYLKWLEDNYWGDTIPDPDERVKFILASYNAGAGHVKDAQRLTEAEGGDPTVWEDVAFWMLKKSDPAVYNRPEVRHGYARGLEPVHYVSIILERYAHYQEFVEGEEGAASVPNQELEG